ncbi:MAG: tRNA preQ1(34) S-adenosylmethionine ribosyltransferase-isomerase QueA [Dehalococcoidales bacterium]|nr:tRNA preQ1(34) S-adenosylmethionine ribosyltransferase-isomerase QueA [Dehalococcoidales bacterium]
MKTSDFDYYLPRELIAQTPLEQRDQSRLMVIRRKNGSIEHSTFARIASYLSAGDLLVFNNSRVLPARLNGRKVSTGGKTEILLLRRNGDGVWEALLKPGRRFKPGTRIEITGVTEHRRDVKAVAEVVGLGTDGVRLLRLSDDSLLAELGEIPLPPYIHTKLTNPGRYQTVYAKINGSVAAPTAGLHFTPKLLKHMQGKGIDCLFTTLHVGLDTFRPISEEDPHRHTIYREYGVIDQLSATEINQARKKGRRVISVGTTTARLLEHVAQISKDGVAPFADWVDLFILPGYHFRITDGLITNFHLPRSTLLMLVSAFAGKSLMEQAYNEAINKGYRFYSFGDAMLIL